MDLDTVCIVALIATASLIITWSLCAKDLKIYSLKWMVASLVTPFLYATFHNTLGGLMLIFWPGAPVLWSYHPSPNQMQAAIYTWSCAIGSNIILYFIIGNIFYFIRSRLKPITVNKYIYYYILIIWVLFCIVYILPLPNETVDVLKRGFYGNLEDKRLTDAAWYFAIASALSGFLLLSYCYKHYNSSLILLSSTIGFIYCLHVTELSISVGEILRRGSIIDTFINGYKDARVFLYQEVLVLLFFIPTITLSLKQLHPPLTIKRFLKSLGMITIAVILFLIAGLILRELAGEAIHYISRYITNSYIPGSCQLCRTEWDINLKIAAYTLYAAIYSLVIFIILKLKKRYKYSPKIQLSLFILYILSSPTLTSWPISRSCGGWGGNCTSHVQAITPIIMSINPLNILISAIVAFCLMKIYFHICSMSTKST